MQNKYWILLKSKFGTIAKIVTFVLISFTFFKQALRKNNEHVIYGDGVEYVLMTVSLQQHFSPDIRNWDYQFFKADIERFQKWKTLPKFDHYDNLNTFTTQENRTFFLAGPGYFWNKKEQAYSYHFWAYSLYSVPFYKYLTRFHPNTRFQLGNAFLVTLTVFVLLFLNKRKWFWNVSTVLILCTSSLYWHIDWIHTELFTMCFLAMGLCFYFEKRFLIAMSFTAIACLQNQPLVLLAAFIGLEYVISKKFKLQSFILPFLIGVISFSPAIFYYYHFGVISIVAEMNYLDNNLISLNRIKSFFFNLNSGMILTIPLVLLLYIPLYLKEVYSAYSKKRFELSLLFPVVILLITATTCSMTVWNHGQVIVNRYSTWISVMVMFHALYMAFRLSPKVNFIVMLLFIITQQVTTRYHQQFAYRDYGKQQILPAFMWATVHFEEYMCPDISELFSRAKVVDEKPFIFIVFNKKPIRLIATQDSLSLLKPYGLDDKEISQLKKEKSYSGYVYVPLKYISKSAKKTRIYKEWKAEVRAYVEKNYPIGSMESNCFLYAHPNMPLEKMQEAFVDERSKLIEDYINFKVEK